MSELHTIIGDYQSFLEEMLQEVVHEGFDLTDFVQMDHMCYRVPSLEQYEIKKKELQKVGALLGENQVNGRPIATFRLHDPVKASGWRVDAVELPAPKVGTPTREGLEHVEFVLYDDLKAFMGKYAGKQFNLNAADRGVNPEVGLRLPSGRGVKFHLLNLPTVIYLEDKLGMTDIRDGQ
jgi:predicted metalloenzyme YecM